MRQIQNLPKKVIRVAYFTHYTDLYGANRSMLDNIRDLRQDYAVQPIVVTNGYGLINAELNRLGVPNISSVFPCWIKSPNSNVEYKEPTDVINELADKLSTCDIDEIHTNSSVLDVGARVAKKLGVPHIWHIREFLEESYGITFMLPMKNAINFMTENSAAVVCISKILRDKYAEYIDDKEKLRLIYDGVSVEPFYTERSEQEFLGSQVDVVVCALLDDQKNQLHVIEAVAMLPKETRSKIKVHFLGDGNAPYKEKLSNAIKAHNLENQFVFHGYVDNTGDYIKQYHIGIMPSRFEAFGRATVEYMLAGCAVIASDSGANTELLDNGKYGAIYRLGDVAELSSRLSNYVNDRHKMYTTAVAGQKNALTHYGANLVAKNIYELYCENVETPKNDMGGGKTVYNVTSVVPSRFISTTQPVSRLFGFDRGVPIDRYYIEKFLSASVASVNEVLHTLEVGDDEYSKKFFPQATHDILDFSAGMDLTKKETLQQNKYDVFICTQVLNFIYDVKTAVAGARYLLKDGGSMLATVAANISPISRYDMERWGHFWGFTYLGIGRIFAEVFGDENTKIIPFGNSMSATAFVQGMALQDLPKIELMDVSDSDYSITIGVVAVKR